MDDEAGDEAGDEVGVEPKKKGARTHIGVNMVRYRKQRVTLVVDMRKTYTASTLMPNKQGHN